MSDWRDFNHDGKVDYVDYMLFEEFEKSLDDSGSYGSSYSSNSGVSNRGYSGKRSLGVLTTWEEILFFVLKLLAVGLIVTLISVHSKLVAFVVLIVLAPFLMES